MQFSPIPASQSALFFTPHISSRFEPICVLAAYKRVGKALLRLPVAGHRKFYIVDPVMNEIQTKRMGSSLFSLRCDHHLRVFTGKKTVPCSSGRPNSTTITIAVTLFVAVSAANLEVLDLFYLAFFPRKLAKLTGRFVEAIGNLFATSSFVLIERR